jgi:hypothetical protein
MVSGGGDGCLLEWRLSDLTRPVSRWQGESAITCVAGPVNNLIVFGTAEGRVCTRDLGTGHVRVLGTHDGPVRGVDVRSGVLVVSWSDSVLFTSLRGVVGGAGGFPGGVSDVLVEDQMCTVLCGDGSVTRRAMPVLGKDSRTDYAILAVSNGTVYTRHNDALLAVTADGASRFVESTEADPTVGNTVGAASATSEFRGVRTTAAMADGSVFTGTSTGVQRHWPADAARGTVTLSRRAGAITAMAVTDRWLLVGGEDGRIALWSTDPVALVREINLGAPVRSVAAGRGLAVARDAHRRLWTFSLDPYPNRDEPTRFLVRGSVDRSGQSVDLVGEPGHYEVTAIRASSNGVPMPVRAVGWWPEMESNGELVVPILPSRQYPIRLVREPPGQAWPGSEGGRSAFEVEVDIVSRREPGYRMTVKPYISWPSFTR